LLLVEDDSTSREMVIRKLKGRFKLLVATDGAEGLRLFTEHSPDLVLTDHFLPGLSGVEMARRIRALNRDTSIILMTAAIDNQTLLEAINLGVNRFIPKPFNFELLFRLLDDLTRELVYRRELGQCRLQELELLRYRDRYNSMQQETARRKERHVARHDLRNQLIFGADGARWGLSVTHSPRDIMCGDGYTIRKLFDGRQLVFVVDAMGSGLSASLSALLATSFCNYQVDHLHQWQNFNLQLFLMRFQEYLGGILLEEEVLSCGFLLVDLEAQQLEMAMFGLPPLMVRTLDGSVRSVRGENPPLCISSDQPKFAMLSLTDIADLMIMTDGVTDASLHDGSSYRDRLKEDFRTTATLASLQRLFRSHTQSSDRDDQTWLHLQRLDIPTDWSWHRESPPQSEALADARDELLESLQAEVGLQDSERRDLETDLGEALDAALKRCFLGSQAEKVRLQSSGASDCELCGQGAPGAPFVSLSASLWRGTKCPLVVFEIAHSGPGLPAEELPGAREGHGLGGIDGPYDAVFTAAPEGRLLFLKTLAGGDRHAA
jgi:two-component system, HptB-dependent secretion and biofilm response regulator